jgi:hypothetical protein
MSPISQQLQFLYQDLENPALTMADFLEMSPSEASRIAVSMNHPELSEYFDYFRLGRVNQQAYTVTLIRVLTDAKRRLQLRPDGQALLDLFNSRLTTGLDSVAQH